MLPLPFVGWRSLSLFARAVTKNMDTNPDLKEYLDAVSKRLAYNSKTDTINMAIVMQLEQDVARMVEMLRVAEIELHAIDAIGDTYEEELCGANAADMWRRAAKARLKMAELAVDGSCSYWGDHEGLSKTKIEVDDDNN